jgi:hypothetical protein
MTLVEGDRGCSSCGINETQAILFRIILPPTIRTPTELCEPCLKVAIDDSKKKGKALEK